MAQYETLRRLVERTLVRLSQVSGISVQTYAEPRIIEAVRSRFEMFFDEHMWPEYVTWTTQTLDGTLGVPTGNMSLLTRPLRKYDDIINIFPDGRKSPLTEPPMVEPPSKITGTNPLYMERNDDDTKIFKVIPYTATGDVHVLYKAHPGDINLEDTVKMDPLLLILAAAYDYVVSDGTNQEAAATLLADLETREDQIALRQARSVPLNPYHGADMVVDWWAS